MKKTKNIALFALFLLLFAVILFLMPTSGVSSVSADYYDDEYDDFYNDEYYNWLRYGFYFENYDVTYDIESDREISVREDLTVTFTGRESTGFIKDIPVNGGELVRGVEVYELIGGEEKSVVHYIYSESGDNFDNFFCIDIGNTANKTNQTHTYRIKYRYCLAKAQEGKNKISLNLIGTGRSSFCEIKNAEIRVLVPDGYLGGEFYAGELGSSDRVDFAKSEQDGKVMLTLSQLALGGKEGVTVNLDFKDGAISLYSEFTPYVFVIILAVLVLVAIGCKLLIFGKNVITPVINFEAPEKLDPLMMGKLIDNVVDNEDVTSMIFYWADKGYIKIDLSDENDPMLIKVIKSLPQSVPDYERALFEGLFRSGDAVKTSLLKYSFYTTVNRATTILDSQVKNLYEKASIVTAFAFALIAGFILGFAPLFIGFTSISQKYFTFTAFFAIIPVIVVNALCQSIKMGELKHKNKSSLVLKIIASILCLVFGAMYVFLVPSFIMPILPRIVLALSGFALSVVSAFIISRTEAYSKKLNDIVGFKEFIRVAEKDRLEKMIEDNPQFYYHVLPYAQVLGVSDVWEEKFASITIPPPNWCTNHYSFFEFYMFNRIMHSCMAGMTSNMCSRPASSGSGGHGGFGGGHSGGGHGGGGFRGR